VTIGTEEGRVIIREEWKDTQYEYDSSGNIIYRGVSTEANASTSENKLWYVWKYTWSTDGPTRKEGPLNGNWDDRASLGWV